MTAEKYRQRRSIAWREIDGEAVLVDPRRGNLLVLNATGLFLWRQLESAASAEELARGLCETFETTYEQALGDVRSFVHTLTERNLVEVQPTAE